MSGDVFQQIRLTDVPVITIMVAGRPGVSGVCEHGAVTELPVGEGRSGPNSQFLEGRLPAPPPAAMLGWTLSWVAPERGEIEVLFDAHEGFSNPMGNVQGGFLAAMLDDTMGPALAATLADGEHAPTLELKVSFLRPASPGRITGTGRVLHRGGSIAFLAGELRDEAGAVLATGTATVRVIRPEPGR
jgi:uncharacterized protein (TIGR00369 family)